MKTPAVAFAVLVLGAVAMTAAVPPPAPTIEPLKVVEKVLPIYPFSLLQIGVREGDVRVAFSVDASGRIEDCLAVAYSRPEFAEATLYALKRWKFAPARYNGQPIAATTELAVRFRVEGTVVVSLNVTDIVNARVSSLLEGSQSFRPRTLKELDRIPTPINAPTPAYPARVAEAGSTRDVTVTFYIDEHGTVRLPSVNAESDPELATNVIDALRHWKFEPPMCKGRPVLVRASQLFKFRAAPPKPAAAASNG